MSAPAVKAFGPAPVITMTRVPESRSSSWRARTSSALSIIDIAFNLSGRFSVMSVVESRGWTRMVSNCIAATGQGRGPT